MKLDFKHLELLVVLLFASYLCFIGFLTPTSFIRGSIRNDGQRASMLHESFYQNTRDYLETDPQLGQHFCQIIQGAAHISKEVAQRYELPTLEAASAQIDDFLEELRKKPRRQHVKRGFFGDLLGGSTGTSGNSAANSNPLGALGGVLGGLTGSTNSSGGLGGLLSDELGSITNDLIGGLDRITGSLGVGLGIGAAQGLNLSTPARISQAASSAATVIGAKPTGLNKLSMSLGSGVTAAVVPLVAKSLALNTADLGQAAFSLAQGVGNGTASGLGLTKKTFEALNGSDLSTLAGNLGLGVSGPIAGSVNISQLFSSSSLAAQVNLGQAAFSLAQGIGNGTSSALGLSKKAFTPLNGSDISSVIGNFGLGISEPIVGSINVSSIFASAVSSTEQQSLAAQLPSIFGSAGKGLGEGAAQGLGILKSSPVVLNTRAVANDTPDIPRVVESFTQSLSSSFLSSSNLSAVNFGRGDIGSSLAAQLPSVISAVGSGLGQGAAEGLGLSNASSSTTIAKRSGDSSVDIPLVAKDFAQSLSSSFVSNVNLSEITEKLGGQNPSAGLNLSQTIGPAALGLGRGLGRGAAIGLGLQKDSTSDTSTSGVSVESVTEDFAQSLSQSFLANGTLNSLASQSSSLLGGGAGALQNINLANVGEGFARGLIGGAADTIQSQGGIQNIIDGKVSVNTAPLNSSFGTSAAAFNDSVGGAATGFGRGLGEEGLALILELIHNSSSSASPTTIAAEVAASGTLSTIVLNGLQRTGTPTPLVKKTINVVQEAQELGYHRSENPPTSSATKHLIVRRQSGGIFSGINMTMVDTLFQKSADALTCEGVGGLLGVAFGLQQSKTLSLTQGGGVLNSSALALPTTPITVTSDGNEFDINLSDLALTINDITLSRFVVITVLHAVFVVAAYLFVLPSFLSLGLIEHIACLVEKALKPKTTKRWRRILEYLVYAPFAVVGVILGIVGMGSSRHFRTLHGIVGLLTLILTAIALALSSAISLLQKSEIMTISSPRQRTRFGFPKKLDIAVVNSAMAPIVLILSFFAVLTGFNDLQSFSFCLVQNVPIPLVVGIGTGIASAFNIFFALYALRWWLQRRLQGVNQGDQEQSKPEFPGRDGMVISAPILSR